jgi:hypothetical protein
MSGNNSLMDWRNSFSLVNNNLNCKSGQTFRGAHSSVQMPSGKTCDIRNGGSAKPGPTTDTSSRIARIKKLQTRTRGNTGKQSIGGTSRGAHATVENASSGNDAKSRRAQLFGDYTSPAGQTSGRGGSSSDVIYFKNVFDRISLNNPKKPGLN